LAIALFLVCGLAHAATAQDTPSAPAALPAHQQQLSANPFGILFGLFNAEFERKVSESATLGLGGSFYEDDDDDYVNGDVFFRYYPSGHPLDSWSFGVKAGATKVDSNTYFGFGFDANWSWLMGKNDNFYLGLGFGLKRLFGTHDDDLKFIPTLRIVNIGVAF
jgi:hypothetical protein